MQMVQSLWEKILVSALSFLGGTLWMGQNLLQDMGTVFCKFSMQPNSIWTIIDQTEIDTFKTYLNNLKLHFVFKTKNMHRKHDLAVSRCMPLSQGSHGNQNLQFSMLNTHTKMAKQGIQTH